MGRVEKTLFISYRRATGSVWALAISQHLTHHGYDVFFDYQGIESGDFQQILLENIKARAHFLVLLTPSALERVEEPDDWLRREVETALEHRRNIVPLMLEGFSFATPSIARYLSGTLAPLKAYNGLTVPIEFFDEAMDRLRTRRLNVAVDAVLHPVSHAARVAAAEQLQAANAAPAAPKDELTAERWLERGVDATELETKILCYTEAIRLKPNYAAAFFNRGVVHRERKEIEAAIADYTEAIRLKPDDAIAFNNRADARRVNGDLEGASRDYSESIRLRPDYAEAFSNRAVLRRTAGDVEGALADADEALRLKPNLAEAFNNRGNVLRAMRKLTAAHADYSQAIRLKPDYVYAYNNRGIVRWTLGDTEGALADYSDAIRLNPHDPLAHYNRALIRIQQQDYAAAIADYQKYLDSGAGRRDGNQAEVERAIQQLREKLGAAGSG